jgi:acyl-CoA thioesterase-1
MKAYGFGRTLSKKARSAWHAACGLWRAKVNPLAISGFFVLMTMMSTGAFAAPIKVLALGDSLTAGYGLPGADAFPMQLQAALTKAGVDAEITNAGVSGDTTAGGLARLDWSLADHPAYALVELGANDALRGIDPKVAYGNLDMILTKLQQAGVKPMLLGMKAPGNWGPDYVKQFDQIYSALAAKHKVPLYPFFLDGVVQQLNSTAAQPDLVQPDGLHPTARGVAIIVERILPQVKDFLVSKPS